MNLSNISDAVRDQLHHPAAHRAALDAERAACDAALRDAQRRERTNATEAVQARHRGDSAALEALEVEHGEMADERARLNRRIAHLAAQEREADRLDDEERRVAHRVAFEKAADDVSAVPQAYGPPLKKVGRAFALLAEGLREIEDIKPGAREKVLRLARLAAADINERHRLLEDAIPAAVCETAIFKDALAQLILASGLPRRGVPVAHIFADVLTVPTARIELSDALAVTTDRIAEVVDRACRLAGINGEGELA